MSSGMNACGGRTIFTLDNLQPLMEFAYKIALHTVYMRNVHFADA